MKPILAALCFATSTIAQWPGTATADVAVGDGAGEQAVPRIAATSDGGCYIGWFDSRGGSYAVYLQRLDGHGVEQWPHNGVLISNNPQNSSLVGWDLICDREDHCVLTFTDTRAGGDLDVYAYRVAPNGAMVWGPNGVALSNNGDYEANPTVCEASDGDLVFVWPNTALATIQMQRLDPAGVPRFPGDGIGIPGDPGATPAFAHIAAADQGGVVVAWIRTLSFNGAKHVHAQKFDAAGNALWNGGTRLPVFDLASVPIAHEPRLLADGQGGAVLGWHYASGAQFSANVQHVLGNGSEAFPHNGVALSTNGNSRFDPALAWLPASQEILAVFNERNQAQSQWGITAQKIDAAGARAFGSSGLTLIPVGGTERQYPVVVPSLDGITAFVFEAQATPTYYKILGMRVDAAGAVAIAPMDVASFASPKLRVVAAATASGTGFCAWSDRRVDSGDVHAQLLNPDGSQLDRLATVLAYGCGTNPAGSLVATGRPAIGTAVTLAVGNPLATQAAGTLAFLAYALAPHAAYPCGQVVPGFGMAGSGANGEILVDPAVLAATFGGVWNGASPVEFVFAPPPTPAYYGLPIFAQGVLLDLAANAPAPIGLTTALRLTIGS
ncbi:MAG: hypothetical protein U1E73_13220 [Planctomycetota bacterium]